MERRWRRRFLKRAPPHSTSRQIVPASSSTMLVPSSVRVTHARLSPTAWSKAVPPAAARAARAMGAMPYWWTE